jgi:hypothetical protein
VVVAGGGHWMKILLMLLHMQLLLLLLQKLVVLHMIGQLSTMHPPNTWPLPPFLLQFELTFEMNYLFID